MSLLSSQASAADKDLPGYSDGADVIQVTQKRGQIDVLSGVVYSQINHLRSVRQLHMTLLVPRNDDLKPALIYFPGGGFTSADHEKYIEMRMALAKAGFVVAAAQYRVIPDKFPALVEDGKAAVRYLRAHAKTYGIDPDRIGVFGDSAGGYMAQMLGTTNGEKAFDVGDFLDTSSDVQAAATLYGISDLLSIGEGFPREIEQVHQSPAVTEALLVNGVAFRDFPGAPISSDPEKARYASPLGHVDGNEPPFLIMHGSADTLVSPMQSKHLYEALRKQGEKATYVLLKGSEHGDISWYQDPVITRVVDWFQKTLGAPVKHGAKSDSKGGTL